MSTRLASVIVSLHRELPLRLLIADKDKSGNPIYRIKMSGRSSRRTKQGRALLQHATQTD